MADEYKDETIDLAFEHRWHQNYYDNCSECFKEKFYNTTQNSVTRDVIKLTNKN